MSAFFDKESAIYKASAPGRMDVMGGIADYSGSLLLQMPIQQTTTAQIQKSNDDKIIIRSISGKSKWDEFTISIDQLANKSYNEIREIVLNMPSGDWAVYVVGCIVVLSKEKKIAVCGLNILIESKVPVGKGVSSSAAIEVAVMCALCKMNSIEVSPTELPLLAQKAENLVVGAPCGLMDQLSSYLGNKNKLLPLICQPHEVLEPIKIPSSISFYAIDSGIRHAVSGASYGEVRAAAFMAYTIIALKDGATIDQLENAVNKSDWNNLPYKGYLANINPSFFDLKYRSLLPESISGKDFIAKYKLSIDTVTKIDPDKTYHLRVCAQHPVMENARIKNFKNLLENFQKQTNKQEALQLMGELMMQSHASYSAVGLGNEYTDELVQMVREAGAAKKVYGARITGGGSGGTVCILCEGKEGRQTAKEIYEAYRAKNKIKSFFFTGSSDGARFLT